MSDLKDYAIMPSSDYQDICDAVREKTGDTALLKSGDLPPAIRSIGSGSSSLVKKNINFYDYDGTLLYSWTIEEAMAATELPDLPSHDGLTCQGWNYDLVAIKSSTMTYIDVGAIYTTDNGNTRILVSITSGDTYFKLLDGSSTLFEIDWGDGTTGSTEIGHTYSQIGEYTIKLSVKDGGSIVFSTGILDSSSAYEAQAYNNFCITAIYIGDDISEIGANAFCRSINARELTLPRGIISIGSSAIDSLLRISHINIPNGVTTIGNNAFAYSNDMAVISIPNGVTSIGNGAFRQSKMLKCVSIPETVLTIGSSIFSGCVSLETDILPPSLTSLPDEAFYNCYKLRTINLPSGITSIGHQAFYNCRSLQNIDIPSKVTSIGYQAFYNCDYLESVTIPSSVTSMSDEIFYLCISLKEVTMQAKMTSDFGSGIFEECVALESITLPSGTTAIPNLTFKNCLALRNITLPSGITSIGENAFRNCRSLRTLKIPSTVTSISGHYTFAYCTSMEYYDFTSHTSVPEVVINGTSNVMFYNIPSDCEIRVPAALYDEWITAKYWSYFASNIVAV